jgi:hypothetical protein
MPDVRVKRRRSDTPRRMEPNLCRVEAELEISRSDLQSLFSRILQGSSRVSGTSLTSAIPLKAAITLKSQEVRVEPIPDSCSAANGRLFDYLVGAREQRLWYRDSECLTPPPQVLNRHCARLRLPTEVSRPRHRTRQFEASQRR